MSEAMAFHIQGLIADGGQVAEPNNPADVVVIHPLAASISPRKDMARNQDRVPFDAMPPEESLAAQPPEPDQPDSADESWPDLAEHVKRASAALESGLIDARGILELVETAGDAELRSTVANYLHSFIRVAERMQTTVDSLHEFVSGRGAIAYAQYTAELKLLSRLTELSEDAGAEALSKLAGAYAALRSTSVVPGG